MDKERLKEIIHECYSRCQCCKSNGPDVTDYLDSILPLSIEEEIKQLQETIRNGRVGTPNVYVRLADLQRQLEQNKPKKLYLVRGQKGQYLVFEKNVDKAYEIVEEEGDKPTGLGGIYDIRKIVNSNTGWSLNITGERLE